MKRDFLEGLKLEADVIDKIMRENGKDIESVKAKYADYDDVKKQLETANATLEKFKEYDDVKDKIKTKVSNLWAMLSAKDEVLGDTHIKLFCKL